MRPLVIAVDFDGTLCESNYPFIGEPHYDTIEWMKELRRNGHKIILWTCRDGMNLVDAIVWCAEHGLFFDAVNDNLESQKKRYKSNSRKILADLYIDDRAILPCEISNLFLKIKLKSKRRSKYEH